MKRSAVALAMVVLTVRADAAVQLTYMIQDKPTAIAWSTRSFPMRYAIDASSAALLSRRDEIARGFSTWQVENTAIRFEQGSPIASTGGRDKINSISISDQLFRDSGFIAFTTTWFNDQGEIQEADIQIDPAGLTPTTNVQALIQHEVGHLLGLDHSANLGSVMYPYVSSMPAGMPSDDRLSVASLYPARAFAVAMASIEGEVRAPHGAVFGAQVVAVDASTGAAVATTLTDKEGKYFFPSLPPGSYRVYAEPLDGPVEVRNFSGVFQKANAGFRTEFFAGEEVVLQAAQRRSGVVVNVNTLAATLNPRWIGTFPADTHDVKLASVASTVRAGETVSIAVGGDGISGSMTTFEVLSGSVRRLSDFRYGSNYVYATFAVDASAPEAPLVVVVRSGSENATLTGALRVEAREGKRARPVR